MILILCRLKIVSEKVGRHCDYLLCSNICCLCCSTFRFTTQRNKFHCQFHFLDLEFVRFLGCLFFWLFGFLAKKLYLFRCTGIFFFVIIQGFAPGYFDDPSVLILAQIFGKRRGFFEFQKYHYFTFWIWNLTEFRLLFVVQPIVFLEALLYFL